MGTFSRRERAQQAENDENADENNADDTEVIALPLEYALLSSKEKNSTKWSLGLSPLQPKNSVHETAHQKKYDRF